MYLQDSHHICVLVSHVTLLFASDGCSWNVQTFMTVLPASSVVIQLQPDMGIYTDFLKFQMINRVPGFVQTLESPGKRHRSWKSPGILK